MSSSAQQNPGHVFIAQTDIVRLSCDFRIVPTNSKGNFEHDLTSKWFSVDAPLCSAEKISKMVAANPPSEFTSGQASVYAVAEWPPHLHPLPLMTNVVQRWQGSGTEPSEADKAKWLAERAREAFDAIALHISSLSPDHKPAFGRERHLVSLPILGCGGGGNGRFTGTVLSHLMPELFRAAWAHSFDIVLTAWSRPQFTAALQTREAFLVANPTYNQTFQDLGDGLLRTAERLARKLSHGKIALFLGAGCSKSVGLPLWKELLTELAERCGITGDELKDLQSLSFLDQSQVIEFRMKKKNGAKNAVPGPDLRQIISEICKSPKFSLVHALTACLPTDQVITTNYDSCYEDAARAFLEYNVPVLPYDNPTKGRWLLKMHGCAVKRPEDIVITRDDYVRYEERHAALSGIVQAQLITKHLLFVGYSMSSDDFWEILSDVRKVVHSDGPKARKRQFGTALWIQKPGLAEELWNNEINMPCFEMTSLPSSDPQNAFDKCLRRQSIFLDMLVWKSVSSTQHLLDMRYDSTLAPPEKVLRDEILKMVGGLSPDVLKSAAFTSFERILEKEFGYPNEKERKKMKQKNRSSSPPQELSVSESERSFSTIEASLPSPSPLSPGNVSFVFPEDLVPFDSIQVGSANDADEHAAEPVPTPPAVISQPTQRQPEADSKKDTLAIVDNRNGKSFELPVTRGMIKATDLGPAEIMSYDPGFMNTAVCRSAITYIDGEQGILRYRGYNIEQLVGKTSFLEVAFLLINGQLPTQDQLTFWTARIMHHTFLHENLAQMLRTFRYDSHPMGMLISGVSALSTFYPQANPALQGSGLYLENEKLRNKQIYRLLGKMPTIAACAYRHRIGRPYNNPVNHLSYTENFLYMMDHMSEPDYKPHPKLAQAIDTLFILHADHELNCSTAAMRHLTSSMVDPYTAVAGAAAALYGPLHGGACEAVLHMLEEIGSVDNVAAYIEQVKSKKKLLFGFGHRIYKNYDPRARIVRQLAEDVFSIVGKDPLIEVACELEKQALSDEYFITRKLYPNVDFYTGLIYRAMGFPTDMFPVLFAIPRTAGWLAHWVESLDDKELRIYRPRQDYIGSEERPFVPLEDRTEDPSMRSLQDFSSAMARRYELGSGVAGVRPTF